MVSDAIARLFGRECQSKGVKQVGNRKTPLTLPRCCPVFGPGPLGAAAETDGGADGAA